MTEQNGAPFDLASLDSMMKAQEEGVEVNIYHPGTGEDLGIVVKVAGPDSKRVHDARRAISDQRLKQRRLQPMTAAEVDREMIVLLSESILDWRGVVVSGQNIEYSREAARRLLERFPFIREQIEKVVGDRRDFIKS